MLIQAAKDLNIDLENSWMIGDSERDLIAGKNTGCSTIFITGSPEKNKYADAQFENLLQAVCFITEKIGAAI